MDNTQDAQTNVTPDAAEKERIRKGNRERKQAQRDREKAQTEAGQKMAISEYTVDRAEALDILRLERGLSRRGAPADNVRKVIYQLAESAAEKLGLPGPNWHLIRYGYAQTKWAMSDSSYVPNDGEFPFDEALLDTYPAGELCTYRELYAMFDMEGLLTPEPDERIDAQVRDGKLTAERAALLKKAGHELQKMADKGMEPDEVFLRVAVVMDMGNLNDEQRAEINALPNEERIARVSTMPYTSRVAKLFNFTFDE